ncbi:Zinc finger, CCHC-type [Trema orientale]|uniref:Zinc finger, CCHC-type n=1 Tax=Trema orientale TaxID=63057 RepID=A0A2P5F113_TREOI|nr:Zinc finger, CCHC-type [Trema orientale]
MTIELANSGDNEALSNENQAIIIQNSLPDSFKEVKSAIKYGRTSITLEEVLLALRSKDLELKVEKQTYSDGENYYVRGRSQQKGNNQRGRSSSKGKGRSNSRGPNASKKCYYCGKVGHIKKECYIWL